MDREYFNATPDIADVGEVEQQLGELAEAGLLISYSDLQKVWKQQPPPPAGAPEIGSVGVVTRNRIQTLQRCVSSYVENVTKLQKHHSRPEYWANDAEAYLDIVAGAVTSKNYLVPQDAIEAVGFDQAREYSKRLVLKFGELLYWWGAIRDTARRLKLDGTRIAVPV